MRFFTRIAVLFYVAIIFFISIFAIAFAVGFIPLEGIYEYLKLAYFDKTVNLGVIITSAAIIFLSFVFARIISGSQQKERTIAFDNPSGRVSVSLSAMEDLVRRLMYKVDEVKEVKPNIFATKKGIQIEARLVLKADVNIPEMTAHLQELTKNKIQEILGVDETVTVRIHIVKITSEQSKSKRSKEGKNEDQEPTVPFKGYRS